VWVYVYTYYLKQLEDDDLMNKLNEFPNDQNIRNNSLFYVYLRKLIIIRREKRFI